MPVHPPIVGVITPLPDGVTCPVCNRLLGVDPPVATLAGGLSLPAADSSDAFAMVREVLEDGSVRITWPARGESILIAAPPEALRG